MLWAGGIEGWVSDMRWGDRAPTRLVIIYFSQPRYPISSILDGGKVMKGTRVEKKSRRTGVAMKVETHGGILAFC